METRKTGKTRKSIYQERANVEMYYSDLKKRFKDKLAVDNNSQVQSDTAIRIELHNKINTYISEGKSKDDILKVISSEEKYSKYAKYIPGWIDDKIKNKNVVKSSFNRDAFII